MSRKKKNQEKSFNSPIHNPPEKYYYDYDNGKYIVSSDNVFDRKFSVMGERITLKEDSELILNIIKRFKLYRYSTKPEIYLNFFRKYNPYKKKLWKSISDENKKNKLFDLTKNISVNFLFWRELMEPIIKFYKIPKKIRLYLFQIYKESTQAKLIDAIKKITDVIHLFYQTQTYFELDTKLKLYEKEYGKLKSVRSGEDVFIYYQLNQLFYELNKRLKKTEQDQIIYMLKYNKICYDRNELKKMQDLRKRVFNKFR